MTPVPSLVVAGDPGVAQRLRDAGGFRAVFPVRSAGGLRELSASGQVAPPAAFLFVPGFAEDIAGAGVAVLANGLATSGFTVVVHGSYATRGDAFNPQVRVITGQVTVSQLKRLLGAGSQPTPAPESAQPSLGSAQPTPGPAQHTPQPAQVALGSARLAAQPTPESRQHAPESAQRTAQPAESALGSAQAAPQPPQAGPASAQHASQPAQAAPQHEQATLGAGQLAPQAGRHAHQSTEAGPEPARAGAGPAEAAPQPPQAGPGSAQPAPGPGQSSSPATQTALGAGQLAAQSAQSALGHGQASPASAQHAPGPGQAATQHEQGALGAGQLAPQAGQHAHQSAEAAPQPPQYGPGSAQHAPGQATPPGAQNGLGAQQPAPGQAQATPESAQPGLEASQAAFGLAQGAPTVGWPGQEGFPAAQDSLNGNPWQAAAGPSVQHNGAGQVASQQARVIAIASAKGGVGKTSLSVGLAAAAARAAAEAGRAGGVVLMDTNFQQADVARYLDLEKPTILDLMQGPSGLSPEAVRQYLAQVPGADLYALLGPPDAIAADPAAINAVLYQRVLTTLRAAFEYVFIDTPVAELYHTTFTDLVLPEADVICVPVEPNRVTLAAARAWLEGVTAPRQAGGAGVDRGKIFLILNRARADVDCGPEEVVDLMPGWRFIGMIPENETWTQAVNNHRLLELQDDHELRAAFRGILHAATGDPVFADSGPGPQAPRWAGRWKRLLGLG